MAEKIHEIAEKMKPICRKLVRANIKLRIIERVSVFRDFFKFIWDRVFLCSTGKYERVARRIFTDKEAVEIEFEAADSASGFGSDDSDLVHLKIGLLGDCQTGKTTFVIRYVGGEQEGFLQMTGLNLINKTFCVRGARIAFSIWDVGGDRSSAYHIPIACKEAVAILFMFDLTSRRTLNSVMEWYSQARKWNKTAIPILIGTKFDDFVQLPPNLQWTIVIQARTYAKAMKATLFFSSATHNINVNKIFKFIMAKLFNLSWTLERNLNLGHPIIDY